MNTIRLTRKFEFETAHLLTNYDGKCKNIHGHSYKLFVTIIGKPEINPESPKLGMVIDFTELKNIVNENIIDKLDHNIILDRKSTLLKQLADNNNIYITDFQPTAENILLHIVEILKDKLPPSGKLFSLRLYETENSYAEWYSSDNQ